MIAYRRRRAPLPALPSLAVEIDIPGREPVRGTLVDVGDGRVVIDVASPEHAALLAGAGTARLTVHAPGVRFEATAAPAGSVEGGGITLIVDPGTKVGRHTA